jgi:hypothetical protein
MEPSAHLLRTFAAVALPETVLVYGDDADRHAPSLAQLGFDTVACTVEGEAAERCRRACDAAGLDVPTYAMPIDDLAFADEQFGWIVATNLAVDVDLSGLHRVLREGGWLFAETGAGAASLTEAFERAGFAVAEAATPAEQVSRTRGIFRRTGVHTTR